MSRRDGIPPRQNYAVMRMIGGAKLVVTFIIIP